MLTANRSSQIGMIYLTKSIKYFFLVDVLFLFCIHDHHYTTIYLTHRIIIAGIILLTYFLGKLQQSQNRSVLFQVFRSGMPQTPLKVPPFNLRAEILLITSSLLIFFLFWMYPAYANNAISNWFLDSILNIEDTPVFGFVFKVIGFFFLINLFVKMTHAFSYLLGGGIGNTSGGSRENHSNAEYTDYEDIE